MPFDPVGLVVGQLREMCLIGTARVSCLLMEYAAYQYRNAVDNRRPESTLNMHIELFLNYLIQYSKKWNTHTLTCRVLF